MLDTRVEGGKYSKGKQSFLTLLFQGYSNVTNIIEYI